MASENDSNKKRITAVAAKGVAVITALPVLIWAVYTVSGDSNLAAALTISAFLGTAGGVILFVAWIDTL